MSRRTKLLIAGIAGAALAAPVAFVFAGNGNFTSGDVSRQTISWSKKQSTKNTKWKPVPGISNPVVTPDAASYTLSAQMTKGAAKFRVVRISDNAIRPPGPVKFTAKGSNSFTFSTVDSCGQGEQHVIEWKRSGPKRAVAAKLSTHAVWDALCL